MGQTWCCNEILRLVLTVANELRENGALDEEECFIDATFVMAKGGGSEIGPTKRGKGMKIMAIVDRHGLPLSVSTHAANHHEVRLVQLCFDFYMIEAKPENLIGDRAYDSDPLDEELRNDGIADGIRESAQSWKELLLDLKRRGLAMAPQLAVADGALGFWRAIDKVWPKTRAQRCWVHKTMS